MKNIIYFAALAVVQVVAAQAVLPGYLTDPSAMKEALAKDSGYQPPDRLKYPYIATYYVKPTIIAGGAQKVSFYVTDFEQSKVRFLDDSHRFTAFLEYRLKDGESKILTLKNLKSGDAEFNLGVLPVGNYEMRVWAVDRKGRESHRVIHDFRVVNAADLKIPADKVYRMTAADLQTYGIRNDGNFEKIVYIETNGTSTVVKEKRAGVPGYTVTISKDPKTGKLPWQAFKQAKVVYDAGYDKRQVETNAVLTAVGIQKLLDDKATNGFRKVVLLPGTYRISHTKRITVPDNMTFDLGKAVIKENAFTGCSSIMVKLASTMDSHLVNGTLEGDYWTHDYAGSDKGSEWCSGFEIGGDSWYSSVENVKVVDITGYGGQNGISKDKKGDLAFFYEDLPKFAPGGLDAKTGVVDTNDTYRFTTDFKNLKKILDKGRTRLQVSKFLGYQGRATRSWQMTVAWYDAEKNFISGETSWQYREMWIPKGAQYIRVSVEDESAEAARKSSLRLTAMRLPVNCSIRRCTFDRCRCVGYAASAMKNYLFEGNYFTASGESAARCAFDAEDGWDQMQDAYFYRNVFRDNPMNNSILTCAGHNFILEENEGDVYFWGRTHSPCVRRNKIYRGTYRCDSRLRSGYGRFDDNTYIKGVILGENSGKDRADNWDFVLSGLNIDGTKNSFDIEVGCAGRLVNCTFRNAPARIANAYACTFENCTDGNVQKGYPGGRWFEVKVINCDFHRFFSKYEWERCHLKGSKLSNFNFGACFTAKKCDFTDCAFWGFSPGSLRLIGCDVTDTSIGCGYWEMPSDFLFKDCKIKTRDDKSLLKLGVYSIGKIGIDGCTVTGQQPLVNIFDLRSHNQSDPAKNPDSKDGGIVVRKTKVSVPAKQVIAHDKVNPGHGSKKKIKITDKGGNSLPPGAVIIDSEIPESWSVK